jgi:hypothetical protein
MKSDLDKRLRMLEAKQPRKKTEFEMMLEKMTEEELRRLEAILERTENVAEFTEPEKHFWDSLVGKYGN